MKAIHQLERYLDRLGLPKGCLPAIAHIYKKMDARIWVIENSYAMNKKDSHLIRATNFDHVEKEDGASRWRELSQSFDFHSKMAARCWIPTKYWLVNEPEGDLPKRFDLCWGKSDEVKGELELVTQIMKDIRLDVKANPLALQLRKIKSYLANEAQGLKDRGEFIGVVVCTEGVPTDKKGNKGGEAFEDFIDSFTSLAKLPVKIIFRLCTDNDQVVEFYNTLDEKFDCNVLDDFWGEAMEVYLHNPWLTYGIGLHRLREAGLGTKWMNLLDETALSLDEIYKFCKEFFVGKNLDMQLTNPSMSFARFIDDLHDILENEKSVWNPVTNKLCPWIDIDKLRAISRRSSVTGRGGLRASYNRGSQPTKIRSPQVKFPSTEGRNGVDCSGQDSRSAHTAQKRSTFSNPQSDSRENLDSHTRRNRRHTEFGREAAQGQNHTTKNWCHTDFDCSNQSAQGPKQETLPCGRRASEDDSRSERKAPRSTFAGNRLTIPTKPKDLDEAIRQWSHQPPLFKTMNPLQKLLVDVPCLFPASNDFVEDHEYFDKWKEFSEDAFQGQTGDDLKDLVRRAARKAKFFLHPDKLPKDLTDSQALLFKSIWNVIQESEGTTLS